MEYNYDEICDVLGIDKELLEELLKDFLDQIDENLMDIKTDIDNRDYISLEKRVHALKGSSANLRLVQLETELVCFDKILKNNEYNTSFAYNETFERLMAYSWNIKEKFIDLL
jgi:HPt (histidine-containing phosphotransfer) domain-containing protein